MHAEPLKRVGIAERIERGINKNKALPKSFKIIKASSVAASIIFAIIIGFQLTKKYKNESLNLGFHSAVTSLKPSTNFENKKIILKNQVKIQNKTETVLSKEDVQYFKDLGHLKEPENLSRIKEIQLEKATIDAKFKAVKKETLPKELVQNELLPKFHVIAGCFGVESNAVKMVKSLKSEGFTNARLAGKSKSGLLRVSYGSYAKKLLALKALAKAKLSHNVNAWLAKD